MLRRSTLHAAIAGLTVFLSAGAASATPTFPAIVQEVTKASSPPGCLICHTNPTGGSGTATTPFAVYLKSRGLEPGDEASLRAALAAMIGEKHDTDGDGVTDLDELAAGDDPSGIASSDVEPVVYGCGGAHVASSVVSSSASWLLAAFAALALLRRRSRPS